MLANHRTSKFQKNDGEYEGVAICVPAQKNDAMGVAGVTGRKSGAGLH